MDISIELTPKTLKAFFAEFLGTLFLTLVVLVSFNVDTGIPTPVLAGLTLGVTVYTIGQLSGSHINPAVTVGLAAIRKISIGNAIGYIVFQLLGALAAWGLLRAFIESDDVVKLAEITTDAFQFGLAEMVGMFVFTFGIGAVVFEKVDDDMNGIVIGSSLFLGIIIASVFSAGLLNPAVALGVEAFEFAYLWGPIVGSLLGFGTAFMLMNEGKKKKKK